MLNEDIYVDDLVKPLKVQPMTRRARTHHNIDVRSIEVVDCVYNGRGLLSVPVAGIYRVEFSDGSNSEILVMGDEQDRDFTSSFYLEKGRSSDQLSEILKIIVLGAKGIVSDNIKKMLSTYNDTVVSATRRRFGY